MAYYKPSINAHSHGHLSSEQGLEWLSQSLLEPKIKDPRAGQGPPTLPAACAVSPTHLPRAPHVGSTRGSHVSPWGPGAWPGAPLPSLPSVPSAFQSLSNRRKLAEQLIFMDRNSIRRRFLWARGRG